MSAARTTAETHDPSQCVCQPQVKVMEDSVCHYTRPGLKTGAAVGGGGDSSLTFNYTGEPARSGLLSGKLVQGDFHHVCPVLSVC